MSTRSFASYVVLLSMLTLSTLGSALHEVAGIHHHCGFSEVEQHSHAHAHTHSHSHANCGHRHFDGSSHGHSEHPDHQCEDDCSLCILLAQSLEFSHSFEFEQCGRLAETADVYCSSCVPNTSCRLADPRGPPVA